MPRRRAVRYSSDEEELIADSDDNSMVDFIDDNDLTEDDSSESSDSDDSNDQTNIDEVLEFTLMNEQLLNDSGHPETSSSISTSPSSVFVVDDEQPGPSRMPRASTGRGRSRGRSARTSAVVGNDAGNQSNGQMATTSDEVPSKKVKLEDQQLNNSASMAFAAAPDENNGCLICFEDYTADGLHRTVSLKCGHLFGKSCIERWIITDKNKKCPTCNAVSKATDIRTIFLGNVAVNGDNAQTKMLHDQIKIMEERIAALEKERDAERERVKELEILYAVPVVDNEFKFTIKKHPRLCQTSLYKDKPSRAFSWSPNGDFVLTSIDTNHMTLKHGIQKIPVGEGQIIKFPTHVAPIRCIHVCPFDSRYVASISEDKELCLRDLSKDMSTPPFKYKLSAPCWTCCWESATTLILGLRNGVIQRITYGGKEPELWSNELDVAINAISYDTEHRTIIVATFKAIYAFRGEKMIELVAERSQTCYYDQNTNCFLLTIPPNKNGKPVMLQLYKVNFEQNITAIKIREHITQSKIMTLMVSSYFWQTHTKKLVCAYYDESRKITRLFNWGKLEDPSALNIKPANERTLSLETQASTSLESVTQFGFLTRETSQPTSVAPNSKEDVFMVQTRNKWYAFYMLYE